LHVAGEHHKVDLPLCDDAFEQRLLLEFGLLRDRQIVEGDAVEVVVAVGLAGVVGDDPDGP
jgi:hypothetical protein